MTRKQKIALGVGIVLLIAAAVLWWLMRPVAPSVVETPVTNSAPVVLPTTDAPTETTPVVETPVATAPADGRSALSRMAAMFAERFGSFSNAGDYENILDLRPFMSDSMARWAEGYVADARAARVGVQPYFGVTTRTLAVSFGDYDETTGRATATVRTQRRASDNQGVERIYYQNLNLRFVRQADTWKADFAAWDSTEDAVAAP